jgi:thiamine biosynthesis lipoprotein
LWDVIQAVLDTARWTGGLVIPAILKSVERAGYDQSFDLLQSGKVEHPNLLHVTAQTDEKTAATGWQDIQLDELSHTIFLPVGLKLDLGGIAKGWAAQQTVRRLQDYGPALLDASGDIAVSGNRADG